MRGAITLLDYHEVYGTKQMHQFYMLLRSLPESAILKVNVIVYLLLLQYEIFYCIPVAKTVFSFYRQASLNEIVYT
jgi:hypothetical protein